MNFPSRLSNLSFLRRRESNLEEIEALLDLFSYACVLVDTRLNHVLLANAKATELTAFTRSELSNLELGALFPNLQPNDFALPSDQNQKTLTTKCLSHNGSEFKAIVGLSQLNPQGSWILVSIEPIVIHELQTSEKQRLSHQLEDLRTLAQACHEENLEQALQISLESGHKLTGASHLAIYLLEPKNPILIREVYWGENVELPTQIPASDVSALINPALWVSGKRSTSTLHRKARAANFNYMASAPLGESRGFVGLVVAADKKGPPIPELISMLKIMATNITAMIQHSSRTAHLLANQRKQLQSITIGDTVKEHVNENIILLGSDLRIIEMNPAAEWTLGYACREVCGQPIENVLIGAENLIPVLQSAQRGVTTHNLGNVRFHRRNGDTFLAHAKILPITFKGNIERIVIIIRDLSKHEEFRVRNQQLEQRALLGEVTAIFAHEVRNNINSISTGLQLLNINLPEDDPHQELVARLVIELDRIEHLMNSALTYSRPVQNTMVPIDMHMLTHRLLERWRPRLARENIQHHIQASTENRMVMGDARTLEQVFTNLFGNAVDAMSETGGTLTVHIRSVKDSADRDQIEISVSDNGPGIPQEHQDRIFDPFFSTSRIGTGLGLAIAKRIVTAHRGTISVTSVPGGTVFQVVLPAVIKNEK